MNALDVVNRLNSLNEEIQILASACDYHEKKGIRSLPYQVLNDAKNVRIKERDEAREALRKTDI